MSSLSPGVSATTVWGQVLGVSLQGQACCPVGATVVWGQLWLLVPALGVPPGTGMSFLLLSCDCHRAVGTLLGVPPWHRDGPKLSVLVP